MNYETVIGLEVHVQMDIKTKAFCGCPIEFAKPANTQVCPVCLGLPGVLPVLNVKFLQNAMRVGLALDCTIANFLKFDRKHYYYPDLPKNYQISQYDKPIASNGYLQINLGANQKKIRILRVHMEEDAGKLMHTKDASLVDLNRTGAPLLEIVTEPDISSADEAYAYLTQLKSILEYLEVSDCDMEKGALRCDANISLRPQGQTTLGTKAEIKNMNSFKGVRDALNYELIRQQKILQAGKSISQETRLWDEQKQKTFSMRSKEEAHDYRYIPDPDLVPFTIEKEAIEAARKQLPELPQSKKERFKQDYGLSEYDAAVLTSEKQLAVYFESLTLEYKKENAKQACNWLINDILSCLNTSNIPIKKLKEILPIKKLVAMLELIDNNTISGKIAKQVLSEMLLTGKDAAMIIKEKNLSQITDPAAIESVIDSVIKENEKVVEEVKNGKDKALIFLVGQVMKKTRGKANPQILNSLIKKKLEA